MSSLPSRNTLFEHINGNPLLVDYVFGHLGPLSIIRYSWACRTTRYSVILWWHRAFHIERRLSRFFRRPKEFRSLQARTGALISGSFALQFFDRTFYPGSDLDLYVDWKWTEEIGTWLLKEGYKFQPRDGSEHATFQMAAQLLLANEPPPPTTTAVVGQIGSNPYFMRGVASVFNFIRTSADKSKVQLITAAQSPLEIILQFHSTAVMNLISYEKAYSLYPIETLENRRSLICATAGPHQEPARQKYRDRGWSMIISVPQHERDNPTSEFRRGCRWLGDKFCFVIPLRTDGIDLPPLSKSGHYARDNLSIHTWAINHPPMPLTTEDDTAVMHFLILQSPVLRQRYVIANQKLCDDLIPKLDTAEKCCAQRAERMANIPIEYLRQREKPLYFDGELQGLCEAFHLVNDRKAAWDYAISIAN